MMRFLGWESLESVKSRSRCCKMSETRKVYGREDPIIHTKRGGRGGEEVREVANDYPTPLGGSG